MSDDDMGMGHALVEPDGKSITDKTFDILAKEWNTDAKGAKELAYELLTGDRKDDGKEQFLLHMYNEAATSQGMSPDQAKDETSKLLKQVLKK